MKQHITEQQWNEITSQQHVTFLKGIGQAASEHIVGIGMILPLPSIGEMMQFLDSQDNEELAFRLHLLIHEGTTETGNRWSFDTNALLATLWESCKKVLTRQGIKP